ncbi:MAG: DUF2116 family Zn-ribbon domain-containing protein [Nanoarchaeota archaeon]
MEKLLSLLKKVLFKQNIEKYTHCINCGKKLKGNQRKYCSDKCNNKYYRKTHRAERR